MAPTKVLNCSHGQALSGVDLVIVNVRVFKEKSEYTFVLFGLPYVFLVCFCICYLQPMIPPKRFDICSP